MHEDYGGHFERGASRGAILRFHQCTFFIVSAEPLSPQAAQIPKISAITRQTALTLHSIARFSSAQSDPTRFERLQKGTQHVGPTNGREVQQPMFYNDNLLLLTFVEIQVTKFPF